MVKMIFIGAKIRNCNIYKGNDMLFDIWSTTNFINNVPIVATITPLYPVITNPFNAAMGRANRV